MKLAHFRLHATQLSWLLVKLTDQGGQVLSFGLILKQKLTRPAIGENAGISLLLTIGVKREGHKNRGPPDCSDFRESR
jgi:hypothetical protein